MPTIQQLAIKLNKESAESLIRNVKAMPEDKVAWAPLENGRTALSQLQECAIICGFTSYALTSHTVPADFKEAYGRELAELGTVEKTVARMEENVAKLTETIEAFPDSDLDVTIKMPFREEPVTLAELMFMTYWNVVYHIGQVCYIQTLYGDNEMH